MQISIRATVSAGLILLSTCDPVCRYGMRACSLLWPTNWITHLCAALLQHLSETDEDNARAPRASCELLA